MPAVELFGGPFDGIIHEIEYGYLVPQGIGILYDDGMIYWYKTRETLEEADYVRREQPKLLPPGSSI
jgi:hypothetical protein